MSIATRKFLSILFGALLVIAIIFGLKSFLTLGSDASCSILYHTQVAAPSGLIFDVTETDCDAIAKEIYAEVYVSKFGDRTKTLIFKYDPELQFRPSIEVVDGKAIIVSIARVSSVFYEAHLWRGMAIQYQIGKIQYPSAIPTGPGNM